MAKAKSAQKKTSTKADEGKAVARPIGQGKDPLAEGNTLVNPTNTEAETHYDVKEKSSDVQAAENTINGQDANERAEQHNASNAAPVTANSDQSEQDAVAEGRQEVNDTPDNVDVPEVSDEDQAKASEEREDALAEDRETFNK